MLVKINWNPNSKQLLNFGLFMLIALPLFGVLLAWKFRSLTPIYWLAAIGAAIEAICIFLPSLGIWLYKAWMGLGYCMGLVMAPLALGIAYYGIFTWLPGIFVQRGFDFLRTYQNTFILALAQLPGYFSAAWLVEKWGRKPTLAVYLGAAAVFTYAFAVADNLPLILGAAIMMSFFALGAWGALYAYTPEVYPTTVRATGMGWASAMARVAGIVAPLLSVRLLGLSLPVALSIYAVSFMLAALVSLLGWETAGRALTDTASEAAGGSSAPQPLSLER